MAKVGVTLAGISAINVVNTVMPFLDSAPMASAAVTSGAGSQAAGLTAPTGVTVFWNVAADGGPVWATFGPHGSVTAVAGTGYLIPTGGVLTLRARPGDDCAIIDA